MFHDGFFKIVTNTFICIIYHFNHFYVYTLVTFVYLHCCKPSHCPFFGTFSFVKLCTHRAVILQSPLLLALGNHYSTLCLYEFDDEFFDSMKFQSLSKPIYNPDICVSTGITSCKMTLI